MSKRNWWYRPQSSARGQKQTTIRDLASYFAWAGGMPAVGDKFRMEGEKLSYLHKIEAVDEKTCEVTYRIAGVKYKLWLDWMIYEPFGPGKTERAPVKPRKKKQKGANAAALQIDWDQLRKKAPGAGPGD